MMFVGKQHWFLRVSSTSVFISILLTEFTAITGQDATQTPEISSSLTTPAIEAEHRMLDEVDDNVQIEALVEYIKSKIDLKKIKSPGDLERETQRILLQMKASGQIVEHPIDEPVAEEHLDSVAEESRKLRTSQSQPVRRRLRTPYGGKLRRRRKNGGLSFHEGLAPPPFVQGHFRSSDRGGPGLRKHRNSGAPSHIKSYISEGGFRPSEPLFSEPFSRPPSAPPGRPNRAPLPQAIPQPRPQAFPNARIPPHAMAADPRHDDMVEEEGCRHFNQDICLQSDFYPTAYIFSSMKRNLDIMHLILTDIRKQSADDLVDGVAAEQEFQYDSQHYFDSPVHGSHAHKDFAAAGGGYICPSEIVYERPQRAKNAEGVWKFIVNFDKYTQTLRMEKCLKPGASCSYTGHHYKSQCAQIYNYQRLLTWDETNGLHMDIFKIPVACSCHIQGYTFPIVARNDPVGNEREMVSTVRPRTQATTTTTKLPGLPTPEEEEDLKRYLAEKRRRLRNGHRRRRPALKEDLRQEDPLSSPSSSGELGRPGVVSSGGGLSSPRTRNDRPRPKDDEPESVNYNYHPIFDFFDTSPTGINSKNRQRYDDDQMLINPMDLYRRAGSVTESESPQFVWKRRTPMEEDVKEGRPRGREGPKLFLDPVDLVELAARLEEMGVYADKLQETTTPSNEATADTTSPVDSEASTPSLREKPFQEEE
ncbi:unnamed protein product [Cyprideis torosa]|uniref:Uncharacterized protein n=1 Tax=Cyprideis torosa TaxID=163714 RepID=A0A7R8W4N8_9CRUS|nr:unnamed protein product [Cyprideis torosa]CAG0882067.1 unnamed protein product [Cyprideis torosa]